MSETDDLAAATKKLKDAEAEIEKWKALSRKNEERAKENADAAQKNAETADELKRLKESSLSDQQKREAADKAQADKLAELEKRANESDARALRAEVVSAKKLTPAQAKRLTGVTREELELDADDLLESFPAPTNGEGGTQQPKPTNRPKERLRGGGEPDEPGEPNVADIVKSIPRT